MRVIFEDIGAISLSVEKKNSWHFYFGRGDFFFVGGGGWGVGEL